MKPLDCEQANLLVDLFAAGECDPPDARAFRAHLDGCPACRSALEQSRQMLGLLDLHFRREAGLDRLSRALRAETKTRRGHVVLLPFVRSIAAAALVTITLGAGMLAIPGLHPGPAPRLDLQASLLVVNPRPEPALPKAFDLGGREAMVPGPAMRARPPDQPVLGPAQPKRVRPARIE